MIVITSRIVRPLLIIGYIAAVTVAIVYADRIAGMVQPFAEFMIKLLLSE